jgi:hypothetical protein
MRMFELGLNEDTSSVCHCIADSIYALVQNDLQLPSLREVDFNSLPSAFHETPAPGLARPIDATKREVRVYYLVPTRSEWLTASGKTAADLSDLCERARPFDDAPGATIASATEEGVAEAKPDLGVSKELLPTELASALEQANDTMTTPLVVFDRRALKVPSLKPAAVSYARRNFENVGFVTVAGTDVPDSEVSAVYEAKIGALPKLHNWKIPKGRDDYVHNVALIIVELQARLVHQQTSKLPASGDPIPGLNSSGAI